MEYNPDRDDPREIEAHAFAAELLMPWEMVAHEAAALRAGTLGPQRAILALAARLHVSRQAAARRLAEWRGVA
jgi:Zn-dependent peptidase ImmA (M78 family)